MALLKTLPSKARCLNRELFARVPFLGGSTACAVSRGFAFVRGLVTALGGRFSRPFCFCFGVRMFLFGCAAHRERGLRLLSRLGFLFFLFLFRLLFDARELTQNFLAFLGSLASSRELHAENLLDDRVESRPRRHTQGGQFINHEGQPRT